MDLGINLLTDDQLVELLIEVCNVLKDRDPIVRKAAQGEIDKKARELKVYREKARSLVYSQEQYETLVDICIQKAITAEKERYVAQLQEEITQAVRAEIQSGRMRAMDPDEEADAIVDAAITARGEVRIHVAQGFSPLWVMGILEDMRLQPHLEEDESRSIRVIMSPKERAMFTAAPGGAAHRIELITSTNRKV